MIISLYDYFNNDILGKEKKIIQLIKEGYSLLCIWIDEDWTIESNDYRREENCVAGYFKYSYREDAGKIRQIREDIELNLDDEVVFTEWSTQCSFVSEEALHNMIYNATYAGRKRLDTYNDEIDYEYDDDFFVQWSANPKEPDRIVLLGPGTEWEEEKEFVLSWADKYPYFSVSPDWERGNMLINSAKFRESIKNDDIVDYLIDQVPILFGDTTGWRDFKKKMQEKYGDEYEEIIVQMYEKDYNKFVEFFTYERLDEFLYGKKEE